MHFSKSLLVACATASAHALSFHDINLPNFAAVGRSMSKLLPARSSTLSARSGTCPPIWTTVTKDLTTMFLSNGQCNDDARAAIRAAFHDCGTWNKAQGSTGGCDGSLILAGETSRPENNGLQDISNKLLTLARKRGVGVADMIQFAGGMLAHKDRPSVTRMLTSPSTCSRDLPQRSPDRHLRWPQRL